MRLFNGRGTRVASALLALSVAMSVVFTAGAAVENDAFERTWNRTDKPVADGQVSRTWMWGPMEPAFERTEPYAEAPDGERLVAYFDKSRMEINDPDAPQDVWYVTNGLLATELITGEMQLGDNSFEQREPANIPVAGDADDIESPTYAAMANVATLPISYEIGEEITQWIAWDGSWSPVAPATGHGVTAAYHDDVTDRVVASVFWEFMNSEGVVWDGESYVTDQLFENPFYATGRPITQPFWAKVKVAGTYQDVLLQCFERRCLTYTPDNPEGWQVEAGNVGQHYFTWRYGDSMPQPSPPSPPAVCVDINTASFDELRLIVHIDEQRAQAIIDLRPFASVDDLIAVSGIGEVRLQEIKDQGLACVNGNGDEPLPGDPEAGALVFQQKGCVACHSVDNEIKSGPPVNGIYGSPQMLADGSTVIVDEAYLRESILDPDAKLVMGYVPMMPTIPVTDQELDDLVSYLMVVE